MYDVRLDGLLRVLDPVALRTLAAPWCLLGQVDELALEVKMQGDHLDVPSFDRACLRRFARQVQRLEDRRDPFDGETPLWYVGSHVSAVIRKRRPITEVARGCYRIGPEWQSTYWIAANELPLEDELVPFLIARTGRPLDEFVRWVKTRRPFTWVLRMLRLLPMTATTLDILQAFKDETDDPVVRANDATILGFLLKKMPERRAEIVAEGKVEGKLEEARRALRRVLRARGVALGAGDEARIDACSVLDTLERWLDQAAMAESVAEALR